MLQHSLRLNGNNSLQLIRMYQNHVLTAKNNNVVATLVWNSLIWKTAYWFQQNPQQWQLEKVPPIPDIVYMF